MARTSHGRAGWPPIYSSIAIETGLAFRGVFHQPLPQTEGLLRSIANVLGIDIAISDHTPLCRRGGDLTILSTCVDHSEPFHLLVGSTGLKIYGEGEGSIRNTASGRAGSGARRTLGLMLSNMRLLPRS